ncbi:MAG: phage integrase N-terminal SAM-like domain-containing protein [Fibromonadaceae bacterium]|jgi:site-specific recombinase XerD|nr:phage integrase N-terminal SAM-like domain-containing protein [Fibromonadaceae bacterium]
MKQNDVLAALERCLVEDKKSEKTKKLYLHVLKNFLEHFRNDINELTECDIEKYFNLRKLNTRNKNLAISALKYLFKKLMGRNLNLVRPCNKLQENEVQILTKDEVLKLLNAEKNTRNKLLFMLVYSGFKMKNVINLKKEQLNSLKIPSKILIFMEQNSYLKHSEYILQFSVKKAELTFQRALINAQINKKAKLKSLKISSIVHLLEMGVSQEFIKTLHGLSSNFSIKQYESFVSHKSIIPNPLELLLYSQCFSMRCFATRL